MAIVFATLTLVLVVAYLGYIVAEWATTGSTLVCNTADEAMSDWAEEMISWLHREERIRIRAEHRDAVLLRVFTRQCREVIRARAEERKALEGADTIMDTDVSIDDTEIDSLVASLVGEILAPPTIPTPTLHFSVSEGMDEDVWTTTEDTKVL